MKFLLVALNSKYIHSNPALYSLRAYVGKELREHVDLAEYRGKSEAGMSSRAPEADGYFYIRFFTEGESDI